VGRQSQGEPIRETFVDTAIARFHYARAGTGPPVLLLPGAGGWRLTFQGMIGVLAQHHTVYALAPQGKAQCGRTCCATWRAFAARRSARANLAAADSVPRGRRWAVMVANMGAGASHTGTHVGFF
jgi:hypothetical protein